MLDPELLPIEEDELEEGPAVLSIELLSAGENEFEDDTRLLDPELLLRLVEEDAEVFGTLYITGELRLLLLREDVEIEEDPRTLLEYEDEDVVSTGLELDAAEEDVVLDIEEELELEDVKFGF